MNASTSGPSGPSGPAGVSSSLTSTTIPPRSRSRILWLATAVSLAALASVLAWWMTRPAPLLVPLPDDLGDLEVRETVARARQQVLDKPSAATWGHLGMVFMANHFEDEASFCFQEASKLDPGDSRWLFCQGVLDLRNENDTAHEQAIRLFRQAVQTNTWPQYASSMRLKLVALLLEKNELDEAEQVLRAIVPREQDALQVAMNLGWIALGRGDRVKARDYFSRATGSIYLRKKATTQLAALARAAGQTEEAARYNKEVAQMKNDEIWTDPLFLEVNKLMVGEKLRRITLRSLEAEHKYQEAAALYQEELKTHPVMENYLGAGMNLARCQDYDHALPLLRQAIQLDPNNDYAQFGLAVTLFRRAEEHLLKDPAAKEEEALGEAVEHAKEATRLKPDHMLAYLIWGSALQALGKREQAILPLKEGIVRKPNIIDLQIKLGEIYFELGKFAEAQRQLEVAEKLDAKDPGVVQLREWLKSKKAK